jgi:hypothetical protein
MKMCDMAVDFPVHKHDENDGWAQLSAAGRSTLRLYANSRNREIMAVGNRFRKGAVDMERGDWRRGEGGRQKWQPYGRRLPRMGFGRAMENAKNGEGGRQEWRPYGRNI